MSCAHSVIVIHAEGSDVPHRLQGADCPCLPRVECALCGGVLAKLGELRALRLCPDRTVHVYPAWQDADE